MVTASPAPPLESHLTTLQDHFCTPQTIQPHCPLAGTSLAIRRTCACNYTATQAVVYGVAPSLIPVAGQLCWFRHKQAHQQQRLLTWALPIPTPAYLVTPNLRRVLYSVSLLPQAASAAMHVQHFSNCQQ